MNDSYMTGTHLNDATIFGPIFWQDRLVGFSATRAHWLDVGCKDPGGPMDSTSIFQEGMRWAPTRIYDGGEPREDIIDLLERNGRFGYSLVGDMNAQVAACRTGEARFQAILDRFGYETYVAAREEIYRQSEALEREAVAAIPDGTYDGVGLRGQRRQRPRADPGGAADRRRRRAHDDRPRGLRADATVGPVNCGFAQTVSACRVAFKLLINPQRPVDGGTFKTLDVGARRARSSRPRSRLPCQWYFTPARPAHRPGRHGARAGAAGRGRGGPLRRLDGAVRRATTRARRRSRSSYVMPHAGGWGGFEGGDGEDGADQQRQRRRSRTTPSRSSR